MVHQFLGKYAYRLEIHHERVYIVLLRSPRQHEVILVALATLHSTFAPRNYQDMRYYNWAWDI